MAANGFCLTLQNYFFIFFCLESLKDEKCIPNNEYYLSLFVMSSNSSKNGILSPSDPLFIFFEFGINSSNMLFYLKDFNFDILLNVCKSRE